MDLLEPPPHAHRVVRSDGEFSLWQIRSGLVIEQGSGILTLEIAHGISEFLRPILESGVKYTVFSDLERLTHYTREAREHLSAFSVEHLDTIAIIHFLISSKFVALGLSTFRDEVGQQRFQSYSERASFLHSLAEAADGGADAVH
jgi:hypothetical protein